MSNFKNNERVEMSLREVNLPRKVLLRDQKVAIQLIKAWDIESSTEKVLDIFKKNHHLLSDQRYWEILRTVWIISGSIQTLPTFLPFFQSTRKHKYFFSTPQEAKYLRELPEEIYIYRAMNVDEIGISWTISREYAEWYQLEYAKETIVTKWIAKKEVFAYINRNQEHEILIL